MAHLRYKYRYHMLWVITCILLSENKYDACKMKHLTLYLFVSSQHFASDLIWSQTV